MTHTKAVILARGLGSRMRKETEGVELDADTAKVASTGVKAMISVGRPFLDYVLSGLADAGFTDVCLVIGPEHNVFKEYYDELKPKRVRLHYAIQEEPLGTANAVLAAEEFAAGDHVAVLNSDNYYPSSALKALSELPGSGLAGFTKRAMVNESNIAEERIAAFALATVNADGNMAELVEKPDAETVERLGDSALVSMNCWMCGPAIFDAARSIPMSARGEYEITDAVRHAIEQGDAYRVVRVDEGVLDMSNRGDIASVKEALSGFEVLL
ncbi:nucleotidyltransferase family protein [Tessaracoccus sp. OH4464_COT-324]|uniref:nucleotidyltransferase family protein n=1 Tax=Tessaracoccus sp. OH4464_COT-324 TaxID=2491059 RepID=UPI000F63DD5A|nr:nucleotidyltransferase family protein [Tessaracoccus sp. OH4464_COT-324]RRD46956.1 nucleotidyltransferase family protein [Tessaracoccus sp. OH4464_COT-324]